MVTTKASHTPTAEPQASRCPLVIVMLGQIQLLFNVFSMSIQGILEDLGIAASSVRLAVSASA